MNPGMALLPLRSREARGSQGKCRPAAFLDRGGVHRQDDWLGPGLPRDVADRTHSGRPGFQVRRAARQLILGVGRKRPSFNEGRMTKPILGKRRSRSAVSSTPAGDHANWWSVHFGANGIRELNTGQFLKDAQGAKQCVVVSAYLGMDWLTKLLR